MAKALLGIATDTNVPEGVRLAAVKDALDRGGIQAKTAVSVEVSAKPFELVFDAITAGPRYEPLPEIEGGDILDEGSDSSVSENGNDEIVGEIDDDEIEDYPSGFIPEQDSGYTDVVDVEVVADGSGTTTPDQDQTDLSVELSPTLGPLGMNGPVGSGMLSLQDAAEAVAAMRQREAARVRNARRR